MPIRAVAFDLDGTLYPNRRMYLRSAALYLTHARVIRHFAAVRKQVRKIRPIDDLHALQAELLAERLAMAVSDARSLIDEVIYRQWESTFRGIRPFAGARTALDSLRKKGFSLHLLTDFPVGRKLEYLGFQDLFGVQMSSEENSYLKPNPEPFLELAHRIGYDPDCIAYIGNHFEYDVIGSKNAGLYPIYLSRSRGENHAGIPRLYRYSELQNVVETVLQEN
jgi:putative hydrolase of the HAD superfamily